MFKLIMSFMQKIKYRLSYRMIVTNICIAVLPIILIGTVGYFYYVHTVKQNALDSIDRFVNQMDNRFDEYFIRMDQMSKSVFYNRNVQQIMLENKTWQDSQMLLTNFNTYLSLDPAIKAISIMNLSDNRIVSAGVFLTSEMQNYLWTTQQSNQLKTQLQFSPPLENDRNRILAYRLIKSVQQNKYLQAIYIGVMVLDSEWINQILKAGDMNNNAKLYILNENGDLIGASTERLADEELQSFAEKLTDIPAEIQMDGTHYLYRSFPIESLGWKFVALIDEDKLLAKATVIKLTLVAFILIMIAIVILIVISFNIRLTHPITRMAEAFDSAASGDLNAKLRFSYKNEITVIEGHYNNMLAQIKKLTDNLLQSQQKLHATEMDKKLFQLNGLQSQINAHFLYNVLHSIRGMSLSNAKQEMATAIDNLVSYFRYITRNDEYVLLFKEMEHLETYIAIQKIRFGDRLQFKSFLDPELMGQSIVKLILQPLVENALFHGLEGKSGRWIIKIQASLTVENEAIIKVIDNGIGMSGEKLASLHKEMNLGSVSSSISNPIGQGIGLVNIHKRIQIYYGVGYGLTLKSWKDRGTIVTIKVPLSTREDGIHV